MTKATTIASAATATAAAVIVAAPVVETKASKARAVFNDCYKDAAAVPQRKDIIARMVAECGLTKAGAATYLQNFKTKAGLVVKKEAAAPAMA